MGQGRRSRRRRLPRRQTSRRGQFRRMAAASQQRKRPHRRHGRLFPPNLPAARCGPPRPRLCRLARRGPPCLPPSPPRGPRPFLRRLRRSPRLQQICCSCCSCGSPLPPPANSRSRPGHPLRLLSRPPLRRPLRKEPPKPDSLQRQVRQQSLQIPEFEEFVSFSKTRPRRKRRRSPARRPKSRLQPEKPRPL